MILETGEHRAISSEGAVDLTSPQYYINREISLLHFHARVLEEAQDESVPLLERLKFLAIVSNNLDEFFMTRVAALWEQLERGVGELPPDGMSANDQLEAIREKATALMQTQRGVYAELSPQLEAQGVRLLKIEDLSHEQREAVNQYFLREIFPVLTPLGVDPGKPFPFISNLSLSLAVALETAEGQLRFARVKVPTDVLPRFIPLRTVMHSPEAPYHYLALEDIIADNLPMLFPGMHIKENAAFRVIRNSDFEIAEEEASDLLEVIENGLNMRRFGMITRVSIDPNMSEYLRTQILSNLNIPPSRVYEVSTPLGMSNFFLLYSQIDLPHLKDAPFVPRRPAILASGEDIFSILRERDILLHHPYDSFTPTIEFIEAAADDPQVLAIKCTLYRTGKNSPIVKALLAARGEGKQVAVLVELKARFDEEANITWAKALEAEGVHVVYGLTGLKTHSKVTLVIRAENNGLRRYVHLSTGNYNATTARLYTDLGFLTSDEQLGEDASLLFNRLTGFAPATQYKKLIVAPEYLRKQMTALIEREIEHAKAGRPARLIFKMNALVDPRMIRRLYQASQAGIPVDLIVRGICCLRPGVPGLSENIQVRSIVGRFLEHARTYYFLNGGQEEIYLGSADLMGRNLDRRVETVFPVESPALKFEILEGILHKQLGDNVKARLLGPDGLYTRYPRPEGEAPLDSQQWFIDQTKHIM